MMLWIWLLCCLFNQLAPGACDEIPQLETRETTTENWGPWSAWGTCTATCGGGIMTRLRSCLDTPPSSLCAGSESRSCNTWACNKGDVALIVGGFNGTGTIPATVLYSPEGWCNYQLAPLPLATHASVIGILNMSITLCGGVWADTKQCWRYNIKTNDWTETLPSNYYHPRNPAVIYNNKMYYLNTISAGKSEVFDPVKNTWTVWKSPTKDHGLHPCMVTWRDSLIVIGGSGYLTGAQMYNITTDTWKALQTNPLGERMHHSCVQMPNSKDKYLVVGKVLENSRDAAIYDASSDSWKRVADTNFPRKHASLVVLGTRVFAIGGVSETSYLDSAEEYIIEKNVWEVKAAKIPYKATGSAALTVPATWFEDKNLIQPLAKGCQGVA